MTKTLGMLALLLFVSCMVPAAHAQLCSYVNGPGPYTPTFTSGEPYDSCGWPDTYYPGYTYTPYVGELANCSSGGDADGQCFTRIESRITCPGGGLNNSSAWNLNNITVGDYMLINIAWFGQTTHNTIGIVQYSADCTLNTQGNLHKIYNLQRSCQP